MKTTSFILAGLLAYSQGSDLQSLESAVAEAATTQSTAGTRSNSWFSSWWSTNQATANTEEKTEVSTVQPVTSETQPRATSSWATYNPLSYFWSSAKTEAEKSETEDDKKIVVRHRRGQVDKSLQSQKDTLESFFSRGNFKISPNAERIIRVRSMISDARSNTEQHFGSLAEQVAFRARMMMGERLNDADLVAEHRIAQVAEDSMAEDLRVAKKKQKRQNKIVAFQQAMQAGKKGNMMADLQDVLQRRRLTYDTQYSIEGSKEESAPVKQVEKAKPVAKVVIQKGKVPIPPPMKKGEKLVEADHVPKTIKRKSTPKKKEASETSASPSANMMAELKSKIGRRKKGDKKSKK